MDGYFKEGNFKEGDLKMCNGQYTIRHTNTSSFVCGEKVFLKSNPEHSMLVHSINETTVTTIWYTKSNGIQLMSDFLPECILQYKYVGLLTYQDKFCVSLN